MKKIYNKLVRDKIPEIIEAEGKKCTYRYLDKNSVEYRRKLADKLVEEACEFRDAVYKDDPGYLYEYSDLMSVLVEMHKTFIPGEIESNILYGTSKMNREEKGRFDKAIFLEEVEDENLSN